LNKIIFYGGSSSKECEKEDEYSEFVLKDLRRKLKLVPVSTYLFSSKICSSMEQSFLRLLWLIWKWIMDIER
jgi:hypothetical protein